MFVICRCKFMLLVSLSLKRPTPMKKEVRVIESVWDKVAEGDHYCKFLLHFHNTFNACLISKAECRRRAEKKEKVKSKYCRLTYTCASYFIRSMPDVLLTLCFYCTGRGKGNV